MKGVVLVAAGLALLAGCGGEDTGNTGDAGPEARRATLGCTGERLTLRVRHSELVSGEEATWTLEAANEGERPVTLTFPDAQRGDVVLFAGSEKVWQWSDDQVFAQSIERLELGACDTAEFTLSGVLDVPPGSYQVSAETSSSPEITGGLREVTVGAR